MAELTQKLYVKVTAPSSLGIKLGKAEIKESFYTRKEAEDSEIPGFVMTQNQAEKFVTKWNNSFKADECKEHE